MSKSSKSKNIKTIIHSLPNIVQSNQLKLSGIPKKQKSPLQQLMSEPSILGQSTPLIPTTLQSRTFRAGELYIFSKNDLIEVPFAFC